MASKLLKSFWNVITEADKNYENQMLTLAKTEYGRDWEWAYHQLIDGRMPRKGVQI